MVLRKMWERTIVNYLCLWGGIITVTLNKMEKTLMEIKMRSKIIPMKKYNGLMRGCRRVGEPLCKDLWIIRFKSIFYN